MTKQCTTWLSGFAGLTLAVAGGMVACNKPATPSADLTRDLDAASSTSSSALTLAPTTGRRDVISAVEQSPDARKAQAPARAQLVVHRTPVVPPPAAAVPQQVTPTTAVATVPAAAAPVTAQATPSKRPTPVQQTQPGRYKTEAEVIRNAPFPINP